jgi:hypothetical protein
MARATNDVVGEARWPMAGAVLAAIVLTILLPDAVRVGPRWLLPLIETVLLLILVAGDPVRISRRSRELRTISIVLVSVLVLATLWSTGQLIDDLIHGGPETNSASDILAAGTAIWFSNIIAFALLYWEVDGGGAAARTHQIPAHADFAFPQQSNPRLARPNWRPLFVDYLYLALHERHGLQPDRRHAPCALGEDDDGRSVVHLDRDPRASDRPGRERLYVNDDRL